MRTIRKAINKDPNSLLYSMRLSSHPSKMKSCQIFTCSLLGNKAKSLEKTRQYARETEVEGFPAALEDSCTYVVILLFVTVEIAHDRFGFSSIWPFLAFSFVPTLLIFFIKLDFHLNRFCYSKNKIDSNEESQGNLFIGRWWTRCPGMYRPFLICTCFSLCCLIGTPYFHLQTCLSWDNNLHRYLKQATRGTRVPWRAAGSFPVCSLLNRDLPKEDNEGCPFCFMGEYRHLFNRPLTLKNIN